MSLSDLLASGFAQCSLAFDQSGGLVAALFMAGLVGGPGHCAGMCGPFVLAQVASRLERVPIARLTEFHRLTGAALVPYHLGRTTTYMALGAVAALVAGGVRSLPGWHWLSAALLGLAALGFLGLAVHRLAGALPFSTRIPGLSGLGAVWAEAVAARVRPLFDQPTGWRGYGLGVALGFIPCGLLYGALAVAAASSDPVAGALGMGAFALGTVPTLMAVGLAGHLAGRLWRRTVAWLAPVIMAGNALVLGYMAWRLAFHA